MQRFTERLQQQSRAAQEPRHSPDQSPCLPAALYSQIAARYGPSSCSEPPQLLSKQSGAVVGGLRTVGPEGRLLRGLREGYCGASNPVDKPSFPIWTLAASHLNRDSLDCRGRHMRWSHQLSQHRHCRVNSCLCFGLDKVVCSQRGHTRCRNSL